MIRIIFSNKKRASSRRILALMLLFVLLLSGCTSMFSKDFLVIKEHEDEYKELELDSSVQIVSNFTGMKNAVMNLVTNASEQGIIRSKNYSGDVAEDISRACFEVTRESPMGVYAVDYMSHEYTKMLSYYEIVVSVSFKRTKEEIDSVFRVNSGSELFKQLDIAIKNYSSSIAIFQMSSSIDKESIIKHVNSLYRNNPQLLYELPKMTITVYPNIESIQKIILIEFDYSRSNFDIAKRMIELSTEAEKMTVDLDAQKESFAALYLTERLIASTIYYRGKDKTETTKAYNAIVSSEADSEGYAMAFKLLCNYMDIECQVIEGRMNSERHFWNIIKISNSYYHVDAFMCDINGIETTFLKRDSDMWGIYWWDTENYNECIGDLTYTSLIESIPDEDINQ